MNNIKNHNELHQPIPGTHIKDLDIKKAIKNFNEFGFCLVKGMFDQDKSQKASNWLRSQNLQKFAKKQWPDWEPGNEMSMYQNVHNIQSPISELAVHPQIIKLASELIGDDMYVWSSKVNFKTAWCGSVDYYHQDYSTYKERGYPYMDMMNAFICLDLHGAYNAGLYVFPGSHKKFVEHMSFINVNGLHKLMIPPNELDKLFDEHGVKFLSADPGDVLFFHTGLVHGSSHNYSPYQRMIILTQLNTKRNKPINIHEKARKQNIQRAKYEMLNAEKLLAKAKEKYELQINSDELTFNTPIPKEEN